MHLISDQLPALGVFYAPEPKLISNRVLNVKAAQAPSSDETWLAQADEAAFKRLQKQ